MTQDLQLPEAKDKPASPPHPPLHVWKGSRTSFRACLKEAGTGPGLGLQRLILPKRVEPRRDFKGGRTAPPPPPVEEPMEGGSSLEWSSAKALVQPPERERWDTLEAPPKPPEAEGSRSEAKGSAERGEGAPPPSPGTFPSDPSPEAQGFSSIPEGALLGCAHPGVSPVPLRGSCSPNHHPPVSGSSTCSSLTGSSQESDEVFSDTEQSPTSPAEKKRVLRKTKSWKTFFTMVHWSLRRRGSWVQLAGHQGNFKPSERGQILKKFSAVEDACLALLMTDALRPFVPAYHGVVEMGGERYIQMDDLLRGLDLPSIMDCKMGTRTYLEEELCKAHERPVARRDLYQKMVKVDPLAPTAQEHSQAAVTKPRYMQWREGISSSATLGFRIEGITIEGGAVQRDFKRTRTKEDIVEIFMMFTKSRADVLDDDASLLQHSSLPWQSAYLARLESMRQALDESTFFKTHEVGRQACCSLASRAMAAKQSSVGTQGQLPRRGRTEVPG
uniref:Kinase n=1 Tax=Pogona vitticeps TaxID=103695 RepID=A0ABM5F3S5_9SAUR